MNGNVRSKRDINPGQNASILSQVSFFFALPIFRRGLGTFKECDVYDAINELRSKSLGNRLEKHWETEKKKNNASLFKALFKSFGLEYIFWGVLVIILSTSMIVVKPILIGKIVSYFVPKQTKVTKKDALLYAGLLIGCIFLSTVITHTYSFNIRKLSLRVKIACSSIIYRKILKQSGSTITKAAVGQAITLMTKDIMIFDPAMFMVHQLCIGVVLLFVMTYMMYIRIQASAFVGIAVLLLFLPLQAFLGSKTTHYRLATAQKTDERIQLTQEVLSTIKVIKMYTWELFFSKSIDGVRRKEIRAYQIQTYLKSLCLSLGMLNGRVALYATIITFVALGNHITAEKAFVITGCFTALRLVLAVYIPLGFVKVADLKATLKRMSEYLLLEEFKECSNVKQVNTKQPQILLKNVKAVYGNNVVLQDINAVLKPGLTLITGAIGSGKSTFLKTLIEDVDSDGIIEISGNISYVSQEPWLFPGTIKQNIIFNEAFDRDRYDNVIRICALSKDFEMFNLGDKTHLTDKGLNLSKGQKARINLARAMYKRASIYLLDDCLSSVDLQVGKHIFYKCIKKFLKNKICLLVSHQHRFLNDVDNIILINKGTLIFHGTYDDLKKSNLEKYFDEYGITKDDVDALGEETQEKVCNEFEDVDENSKLLLGSDKSSKNVYEEINEDGVVTKDVYYRYFSSGGITLFLCVIVIAIASQGAESWSDYFIRFWVDSEQKLSTIKMQYTTNSTEYKAAQESSHYLMNWYSLVIASALILVISRAFLFFWFASRISIKIHRIILNNIVNAAMVFFDKNLAGNIINRLSRDFSVVDEHLPFSLFQCIKVTLMLIAILTVISSVNFWFLIPSAMFGLILYFGCRVYLVSGRNIRRIEGSTRSPVVGHLQATFDGLTTIKASQAQNVVKDEFDDYNDVYNSTQYMHLATVEAFSFYMDMISGLYITVITFSLVLFEHDSGAGGVGLAITQSYALTGLLQWCVRQWSELEIQMTSTERVLEYIKVETEKKSGATLNDWPNKGKIVYKDVSLRYVETSELVLKNVNFTVGAKEKVGVVGRTGAGKSSILSTLFRLYAFEGMITIDDMDITTLKIELLRSKISIIPQDPILFSGTIRSNLDPNNKYTEQDLWNALEEVEMKKKITSLEQGISEKGCNFSIGQKQLICLARAILQNNLILVLDEATANVDSQTDSLIQSTIRRIFADTTVITIAHRLHTILDCDKVLVMDCGIAVEYDHPNSLINSKKGLFYSMVKEAGLLPHENLHSIK